MSRTFVGFWLGVISAAVGCNSAPVLTQRIEARALVADLRLQFNRAADASNGAVMADADEGRGDAVRGSDDAVRAIEQDTQALRAILQDLNYAAEVRLLEQFDGRFMEYQKLHPTIRDPAVENTDLQPSQIAERCAAEMTRLRRRTLAAACDDDLRALQTALQSHEFHATR